MRVRVCGMDTSAACQRRVRADRAPVIPFFVMNGGGVNVGGGVRGPRMSAWLALNIGLVLAAACSLVGCNGKSENGGGGGGGGGGGEHASTAIPVAAVSFGQSFATAFCAIGPCCQRAGYTF